MITVSVSARDPRFFAARFVAQVEHERCQSGADFIANIAKIANIANISGERKGDRGL
jgi:hypothetical protein